MSGRATDWKVVLSMASAMAWPAVVEARGEAAEIEHARDGRGVHLDDSGMELGGRAHDAHAVGVGEVAQDPAFVLHSVLHADDGDGRRGGAQLGQRVIGVLPLHAQEDDGVLGPGHLRRFGHHGDGQGDGLVRRLEAKARRGQGLTVLTTGNQGDVVALLEQAGTHRAADGTGTQDDEAHACTLPRLPWQALRVAAMHAFERAAALGESVAATPLRLVGGLAAPARGGMERSVRRAIGIRDERGVISRDPDEAFTPPDGVARRVHAGPVLHAHRRRRARCCSRPCIRWPWRGWRITRATGTTHSGGCAAPRSSSGTTTYGTTAQADAAVAQVLRVHRRVKGTSPDGRKYSADDPELVTFIHVAEVSSFLASSQRYGPREPEPHRARPVLRGAGARRLQPRGQVGAAHGRRGGGATCCGCGPSSTPARRPARPGTGCCAAWAGSPGERAVYSLVVASAIGVLPGWARRELGLSVLPPVDFMVDTSQSRR